MVMNIVSNILFCGYYGAFHLFLWLTADLFSTLFMVINNEWLNFIQPVNKNYKEQDMHRSALNVANAIGFELL